MDDLAPHCRLVAEPPTKTPERLQKLLDFHLHFHEIQGSTPATLKHKSKEIGLFHRFLEFRGHSMLITDLTHFDVMEHLRDMQLRGRKPASVNTRCRAIRAFLQWAVEWEFIAVHPMAKIESPKVPKFWKPFLPNGAFQQILDICPQNTFHGARRQAMLLIFATTGMRHREMFTLRLTDLDWDKGVIRVEGKGQKERRVAFTRDTQVAVLKYLRHRQDSLSALWVTKFGARLRYDGIGHDLNTILKRAGLTLPDACHIFRRTWAANAVRQAVARPYVEATGGWDSPYMVDRYVKAMEQEEGPAIEALKEFDPFR